MVLQEALCDTPLGLYRIVCTETALYAIERAKGAQAQWEPGPLANRLKGEMREYFSGARRQFDVALAARGTAFQRRVWEAVREIPYGQTRSYGEVARMVGRPKAARAVGSAMAATPFPLVVPCHRVIAAGSSRARYAEHEFLLGMERRMLRETMEKPYILFDLDGTITDPKEGITKSVQYALEDFGIQEPDLEKLTCFIGPPLVQSFQEYYGFDEAEAQRAVQRYRQRFAEVGIFENGVYEGVHEMLSELNNAGKTLCLATSKPGVFAKKILEHYHLAPYFTVVVGSELDGRRSDKAEVIEEVLHRLAITESREKAVMVGDRRHDILGAKRCGLTSVGVSFGYAEPGELEKAGADYVVSSVAELGELLQSF